MAKNFRRRACHARLMGEGKVRMARPTYAEQNLITSFPRAAWECIAGRAASRV